MANIEVVKISVLKLQQLILLFAQLFLNFLCSWKIRYFESIRKLDWSLNLKNNLLKSIQYFLIKSLFLNCAYVRLEIANILKVIIPRHACKKCVFKNITTR